MLFSPVRLASFSFRTVCASATFAALALLASAAPDTVFEGEKFVVHTVVDQQQGGIPYVAFQTPVSWQVSGGVQWRYENVSLPCTAYIHAINPEKHEELTFFPQTACYWLSGAAAFNRPGTTALGQINLQPMSPRDTIASAVQKIYRANQSGLQFLGYRELPNLAATVGSDPQQFHGVGLKVSYTENGQAFDEEFYALYYNGQIPYDGPQGRSIQTNWGLYYVHSFKAPHDTLEKRRPIFAYMVHSLKVSPQWLERQAALQKAIGDQFNRNLAQGYANIEAAGRLSRQISANSDAMIASMDRQRAASNSSAAAATTRSSNDRFDDYVRGVDTMNDPLTGTSQHSSNEQYHWTDGYGNYTHSNDASFNPNQTSNVTWQQMTPAR